MSGVNLLEIASSKPRGGLELIRVGGNAVVILPFTPEGEEVLLHFCEEVEIRGYVHCNGKDCILCRIGKKAETRILIPVYLPTSQTLGVLPVSNSIRPYALLPQLLPVLKSKKPAAVLLSRESSRFMVSSPLPVKGSMDSGAEQVKAFTELDEAVRKSRLRAVFQKIENSQLSVIPEVARVLSLLEGSVATD